MLQSPQAYSSYRLLTLAKLFQLVIPYPISILSTIQLVRMDKKVDDVIQAFREQQFDQALRLINVAEKKKEKAKQKPVASLQQDLAMDMLKASCLVKLARYGEAQAVLTAVVVPEKLQPDYAPILLGAMRDTKMQEKQSQILRVAESQKDLLYTKQRKGYFVAQYVYLNKGRLEDASKFFLKLYDSSKSEVHFFSSVYLGYLAVMAKNGLLLQKRDKVIVGKETTNLKMIFLFWEKFLKLHPLESLLGKKLGEEVVKFNARLLISSCQPQKAIEFLQEYDLHLTDCWDTLSLYRSIYDQSPETLPSLLQAYLRIFRQNTDLALYKPLQEAYYNYVDLLLKVSTAKINQGTNVCELFQLEIAPEDRLNSFLASLVADYNQKRSQQQKSSDYYKFSLKTSLLTILYILNRTDNKEARDSYIQDYVSLFSNTFTFAEEFLGISPQPRVLAKPENWKADNSIIFDINQVKLGYLWRVQKIPGSIDQLKELTKKFVGLYQAAVSLQAMAVLEKGQRLLGDQFIIILNDVFRQYLLHQKDFEAVVNIVSILESTLRRSPYNFDIKVGLIKWYDRLGSPLRLVQIYETMDIKSAQFETLGYLLYKHIYEFRLYNQLEEVLLKAIRSYQENEKEIQEYSYNCLDQQRHSVIEQFMSYHSFLQRSFSKIVLLLVLSRLPRFRSTLNEKALVELALRSMSSQLTFSCDWKAQNSVVEPKRQFCSFFGVFNSPEVVRMQLGCRLQQLELLEQSNVQRLKPEHTMETRTDFQSVLAFGLETVQERYVYSPVGSLEQLHLKQVFSLYDVLSRLGFSINRQLSQIKEGKESEFSQVKVLVGRLREQSGEMNARLMIMTQQKVADIIELLNHYIQLQRKRKKKLKEHEKASLNQLLEVREYCYQIVCSYKVRPSVFELWTPSESFCQEFRKTETQLNNLASIERREFDKLYKIQ